MNRSQVIRLNPTPAQEVYFRKACGVARHAYNWALARWKDERAAGKWAKMKDLKAEYNKIKGEQFPWCYEVTKCAPEQEFSHLGHAIDNYWRMKKEGTLPKLKHPRKDGEEGGFPRFKSKKRDRLSFYLANDKFTVDGHTIRIPKLGTVNMTEALRFAGKILSAVISYRAGWWFVSISVEVKHEVPVHNGEAVGIDLGIKTLVLSSLNAVTKESAKVAMILGKPSPDPRLGSQIELSGGDAGGLLDFLGIGEALTGERIAAEEAPPALLQIEPARSGGDEDLVEARMPF